MWFKKFREKEFKMIWRVEKGSKRSFLAGTAHFFPYSFKTSLHRYLKDARTVIFEGPLDDDNMARVVREGFERENPSHLFDQLDEQTIEKITRVLAPACRRPNSSFAFDLWGLRADNPVYEMVRGMKPWLAFFTIWQHYLKRRGWKYSVDLEAFRIAQGQDSNIVFLETIVEQIKVLENLSHERILQFLQRVDRWPELARDYARNYLDGNLEKLGSMRIAFPSRHPAVINPRDRIFFERMQAVLKEGDVAAFVGAPHIRGLSGLLQKEGYQIKGPRIPD